MVNSMHDTPTVLKKIIARKWEEIAERRPLRSEQALLQLARQAVEAAKQTHELEVAQKRKKAREEALIRAAEARLAATDETSDKKESDFDDNDDDDDDDMKDF